MFLALSGPVIFDLRINTVVWLIRCGPVGVPKKPEIFNNLSFPVHHITDGLNMPGVEYVETGESLSASMSTAAKSG